MKESLISKVNKLSIDLKKQEAELEKCTQVSRTKKEIMEIASKTREKTTAIRKKIAGYRSVLEPIVAGAEGNTLEDEIMAICEDIGTAIFHLQQGKADEASKVLYEINQRTRGY